MKEIVIVSAVRTPIGSFGGSLSKVPVQELGAVVIREALIRAGVDPNEVDQVIMGCVLQAGYGQNVSRQAAITAGLSNETQAFTINYVCGSGLKSVVLGAQALITGDADIVVAGGMENMSQAPYLLDKARFGYRMGHGQMKDSMISDGLWCAIGDTHMGITAENVAQQWNITREMQDEFATSSQNKAQAAIKSGRFKDEIIPVKITERKGTRVFETDEYPRTGVTAESLAHLKPAFKKGGTVTAGNASGINDGAAAFVLMSREKADELGITPLASLTASASVGLDPTVMGTGPIEATRKALGRAEWEMSDIELIEANEAFASQSIAVANVLNFKRDIVNVNGGSIALGHPIGASGARILVTLLYEMKKRDAKKGLATMCIGGGQGISVLVER